MVTLRAGALGNFFDRIINTFSISMKTYLLLKIYWSENIQEEIGFDQFPSTA